MARTLLKAVLAAVAVSGPGCARWYGDQSSSYVTTGADSQHDSEKARKDYNAARHYLNKRLRGEDCDLVRVEKKLQSALAADVRFGPAHHTLGVLYFWQRKLYLAAWEFEYTSRLMPDRFEPLNNLGLVYESAGKYDQAKTYYCLAREKSPHQPDVISNLARVSFRSGMKVDQMRPLLEDVLATNPRPEWRRWAAELLGVNPPECPVEVPNGSVPAVPLQPDVSPPAEELPLLPPPQPDAKPAPIPAELIAPPPVEIEFQSNKLDASR